MNARSRWLAAVDIQDYGLGAFRADLTAAFTVTFLSVPQGVAYAMIAGLPPAMGLYSACLPTIFGSLVRSSRHVVTGPTNALSLLVGSMGAAAAGLDPVPTALLLAFLVGSIQLGAGLLRLGVFVDYISIPVVIGYIAGAASLIAVGQLPNLTETPSSPGHIVGKVVSWFSRLNDANSLSVAVGLVTAAFIVVLRRWNRRLPSAMIALTAATVLSWALDLSVRGLRTVRDLSPVPAGLPPLTFPNGTDWSFTGWSELMPLAFAATVLSLVESSAVGRAISSQTGQRLALDREFVGQGVANLVAAFCGGYPCSGSLSRSALNHRAGAQSRLAGVYSGFLLLAVLLVLGPAVNYTPISALAGLLFVVAFDLVDVPRIRKIFRARRSDGVAFVATVLATWTLRLDHAIYLGVAVSLFLYMRRARILGLHHIAFDDEGRVMELRLDDPHAADVTCRKIRLLNVEGQLFFASAGELRAALDRFVNDPAVEVLIVRLRRIQGLDVTSLEVLEAAGERMQEDGRELFLVGLHEGPCGVLKRTGVTATLGEEHVIPTNLRWFQAADSAMKTALERVGEQRCADCPVHRHLGTLTP